MNKKSLFGLFAMGTLLFAASCQEEDVVEQTQENTLATVSINVTTPEMGVATRAKNFGNGKTAQTLHYAVYNVKDQGLTYLPDLTVDNHPIDISTTVDLQLVTGNNYKVIFWAGNDAAISTENEDRLYTLNWDAKDENGDCNPTMTVNYDKAFSNQEAYDAFFNWMDINVDKSKTVSITLNRPFAQLNIGASDIDKAESAGYKLKQTRVQMTAYTTLEFWSRDVDRNSETTVLVDFKATDYPNYGKTKPENKEDLATSDWEEYQVEGYEYMAMNYLLRPLDEDRELEDVYFYFYAEDGEAKERKYANVPFRRNWRTNVYGQLITSDVDVNVTIDPIFTGSYNIGVWDGHTLTKPYSFLLNDNNTPDIKDDIYEVHVYNGNELAYIADAINGGGQSNAENNGTRAAESDDKVDYCNATIVLKENIDLGGENWTPIKQLLGTFDGNGYTISNLNVSTEKNAPAGLFAAARNVKNLTVKDAKVYGHYKTGVIAGDGLCGKFENCRVENAKILVTPFEQNDANNVGGIVGYLSAEPTAYVKGCTVKNAEIVAYRKVGGIVGAANRKSEVTGNTVENVTVVADFTMEYNEVKPADVGAIVGWAHQDATVSDNNEVAPVFAGNKLADGVYIVNGVYEISNANGMRWFYDQLMANNTFKGQTVKLTENIDMNGIEWDSHAANGRRTNFQGVLDGNGKTISNFTAKASAEGGYATMFDLFNGEVKNLTLDGVTATDNTPNGRASALAGYMSGGKLSGVTVKNVVATGYQKVAGLVSHPCDTEITIENCRVENATLKPSKVGSILWQAGGLAGYASGFKGLTVTGCSVENISILNAAMKADCGDNPFYCHPFFGCIDYNGKEATTATLTNNTVSGTNTITDIHESGCEYFGWGKHRSTGKLTIMIDGKEFISIASQEQLAAALSDQSIENATLYLAAAEETYNFDLYANSSSKKTLNIVGTEGTKVAFNNLQLRAELYDEFTISNCEIMRMPNKAWGMMVFSSSNNANGVYTIKNCTFNGVGTQGIYINEQVSGATYNILDCTFNGDFGNEGAITVQNNTDVNHTVNVKGCTFNNVVEGHKIYIIGNYNGWTLNTDESDVNWSGANPNI